MKLLFVSKRRPQGRDLVTRPYGRFFWLPRLLHDAGHDARLLLVGHAGEVEVRTEVEALPCLALDLRTLGPFALRKRLREEAAAFQPDWIVGCSDAWVGVVARDLALRAGTKLALDAYDDYESYMPWNLPLRLAWRRALAKAQLVTAAGPQLATLLHVHRRDAPAVAVLPMAADPGFVPMPQGEARAALALPAQAPLLGYFGGWARRRGTRVLLDAFERVRAQLPEARLVLSGRPPAQALRAPGVAGLGYLEDAQLPVALNAVDVACVLTADSAFGRYSYPAKLCEAMACLRPVAASDSAPVRWMLHDDPSHLARLGDPQALAARILALLHAPSADYGPRVEWPQVAAAFASLLADGLAA